MDSAEGAEPDGTPPELADAMAHLKLFVVELARAAARRDHDAAVAAAHLDREAVTGASSASGLQNPSRQQRLKASREP